jgi:hypothetical protein
MNANDLKSKIAHLESKQDYLLAELTYIDDILRKAGFDEGLTTLKGAAEELAAFYKDEEQP